MMLNKAKSNKLTPAWEAYYPGGHTNFKAWPVGNRTFANRSKGSHIWDVDGNEYIEYTGAMGPTIIGHQHPEFVAALKDFLDEQAPLLGSAQLCSPDDIKVAEKVTRHVPCAETLKFSLSGSDAVQMAIRLSRAYTGRKYFIRFTGNYHGWYDNVYAGQLSKDPDEKPFPYYSDEADPSKDLSGTRGISEFGRRECFLLPYNDMDALENVLEKYGHEIALIHVEPIVVNHFGFRAKPGYLERIRELCTKYGIVMSFDEVITGFRVGLNGAQGLLGVTPDIATFGKAIAGGLPMAAVVGKAEILEQMRDRTVLGPGTFNGWPMGMRAALTTLKILERNNGEVYDRMAKVQKVLEDGLYDIAKKHSVPFHIQSAPNAVWILFGIERDGDLYTDDDVKNLRSDLQDKFWLDMQDEGIMLMRGGRLYMNMAHSIEDVEKTIAAADKVMSRF